MKRTDHDVGFGFVEFENSKARAPLCFLPRAASFRGSDRGELLYFLEIGCGGCCPAVQWQTVHGPAVSSVLSWVLWRLLRGRRSLIHAAFSSHSWRSTPSFMVLDDRLLGLLSSSLARIDAVVGSKIGTSLSLRRAFLVQETDSCGGLAVDHVAMIAAAHLPDVVLLDTASTCLASPARRAGRI